jgi:hypothetical protein
MPTGRIAAAICGLVLVGQLAGCGQERPRAAAAERGPVVLTEFGACGDAFFWATTTSGDTAVTVAVDVLARTAGEPTTVAFSLPDPAVAVDILSGQDLARNFCTDLPDATADPAGTQAATAGAGVITVGAPVEATAACGSVRGTLSLDGLIAEDGAVFAPIRGTTDSIGCYSG